MRYKITITEETQEKKIAGNNWEKGADPDNHNDGWGYTPEIEKTVDVKREVYSQNTDTLDLKAVIMAINSLPLVVREGDISLDDLNTRL